MASLKTPEVGTEESDCEYDGDENNCFSINELCGILEEDNEVCKGSSTLPKLSLNNKPIRRKLEDDFDIDDSPSAEVLHVDNEVDPDIDAFVQISTGKRQRKRRAVKSEWDREVNKSKRMKGEQYDGFGGAICKETGKKLFRTGVARPERHMGAPCRSNYCQKRNEMRCSEFTEDDRSEIFNLFWKTMDWGEKETFVTSLIDTVPCKRRRKAESTRRQSTNIFFLKLNERKVQVCRRMFESTLGLGRNTVAGWIKKSNKCFEICPKQKSPRQCKGKVHAEKFLDQIPKLPSHYSRMLSTKLYLEPHINSKNELYDLYKKNCKANNYPSVSRFTLNRLLEVKNIGVFQLRKDLCDTCESYKVKQVSEEAYQQHIMNKDLAQKQKKQDKLAAFEGKCHVICMDLQAVKLSPMLKASALYYKCKLMVHNFTLYNLKTKECVCYWWNETEGDLTASVFASCLSNYILSYYQEDKLPIVIYSDGCCYQNRNTMVSNALLEVAITQKRLITQKYLEKGHTYMECDSVHSAIEAELKNKPVYVPTDYLKITQNARTNQPYIVKYVKHDFFKDYSLKRNQRYTSIRPGTKKGDPVVTDLKNIQYSPDSTISYKLGYEEDEWHSLKTGKKMLKVTYPSLFQNRIKVPLRKFNDLQALKAVIPTEFHNFYDELPHTSKED